MKNLQFREGGQPPYKRMGYAVYPDGWLPRGKGEDFFLEVFFTPKIKTNHFDKPTNLVVIFNSM